MWLYSYRELGRCTRRLGLNNTLYFKETTTEDIDWINLIVKMADSVKTNFFLGNFTKLPGAGQYSVKYELGRICKEILACSTA
jgi:hypothetical protein